MINQLAGITDKDSMEMRVQKRDNYLRELKDEIIPKIKYLGHLRTMKADKEIEELISSVITRTVEELKKQEHKREGMKTLKENFKRQQKNTFLKRWALNSKFLKLDLASRAHELFEGSERANFYLQACSAESQSYRSNSTSCNPNYNVTTTMPGNLSQAIFI